MNNNKKKVRYDTVEGFVRTVCQWWRDSRQEGNVETVYASEIRRHRKSKKRETHSVCWGEGGEKGAQEGVMVPIRTWRG